MEQSIQKRMNDRIRKVMKERTGPSFEERVAERAAIFRAKAEATEASQLKKIEEALARARVKPCESPLRSKDLTPPSIEEMGKQHARTRRENEKRYERLAAERKNRMDTREPLFRLSEVSAAFEMQQRRQAEHRQRLQEEENRRWEHLAELQQRVIDRPLLMENPEATVADNAPATEDPTNTQPAETDPNWKEKFQAKMHKRIQHTIKTRSGPSFEERSAERAAKFRKEAKTTEDEQTKIIEEAIARAKAKPCESPLRSKELTPPSIEVFGKQHAQTRRENEARYAEEYAQRKSKLDTREPLFRISEVEAAVEMQRQRRIKHKKELREDEEQRWAHLNSMQERVVHRPLLVEAFERPVHSKSATEVRLIPNHTKPLAIEDNIKKCVSATWFKESAWGKEVSGLKERMDARQRLHEIPYPPKVFPEKPPPPKMRTPLDKRLEDVINQRWFKTSQWASEVAAIRQRQDDRPKLHELSYPPKVYD